MTAGADYSLNLNPDSTMSGKPIPRIAFGPNLAEIGSWQWVGQEMIDELAGLYKTMTFQKEIPQCDVAVIVKYNLPADEISRAAQNTAVIYCPIDYYGSPAEIDRDAHILQRCSRIVVHSECLRKYFQSYARVDLIDHHVRFVADSEGDVNESGSILWAGMRTNLPPLVEWVNNHSLPADLAILTNLENNQITVHPDKFGFRTNGHAIQIENWTAEKHKQWTARARAAIDIKGSDFRQRHKPPSKAIDFIASGVPLAMNADSNPVRHLREMGFDVAAPEDTGRWLSSDYRNETQRFGRVLRELYSRKRIARRFSRIINDVLIERRN